MKNRALKFAVLATIVVVSALVLFIFHTIQDTLSVDQKALLHSYASQIEEQINTTARSLAAEAELASNIPPVQKSLQSNNREELIGLLGESYSILRQRYGVAVGQINSVNGTVLHRFHEPENHGDNFINSRKIIVAVHAGKQAQNGVEIGSSGVRVRGASPVIQGGVVVGSVEFGQELGPLLEALKARTNADFAVILDRKLLHTRPGVPESNVFGDLKGDSATNWPLIAKMHELGKITLVKEPAYNFMKLDNTPVGAITVPLLDYSGSELGVIVAAKTFGDDTRSLKRLGVTLAGGGVVAVIGLIGVILVTFSGMLLRPVAAIAKATDDIAKHGNPDAAMSELPKPGGVPEINHLIDSAKRLYGKFPKTGDRA